MPAGFSSTEDHSFVWVQSLDGRQAWPDDRLSHEARDFAIQLLSEKLEEISDTEQNTQSTPD
jgi:hypothetical protein